MKKNLLLGCLIVSVFICLGFGSFVTRLFRSTVREPRFPVHQLLQKQLAVFPNGWELRELYTTADDTLTWANWVFLSGFKLKNGADSVSEHIHVFANSFLAEHIPFPSLSYASSNPGYTPSGWSYHPSHADSFEFLCFGVDDTSRPKLCGFIARYEEYVIEFYGPYESSVGEHLSLDDFMAILEVIDKEMFIYLQASTLHPGGRPTPTGTKW